MRVLVCGSRDFTDYNLLKETLDAYSNITEIIHGAAHGADTLGGRYGREIGVDVTPFPAYWNTYGKGAGPLRNTRMLTEGKPDIVVAFKRPGSRGTENMIDQVRKAGVEVVVVDVPVEGLQEPQRSPLVSLNED